MKRPIPVLVLLVCAPVAATLHAQSLEDVVQKYVDARGGLEALRNVTSIDSAGTASFPNGFSMPFRYEWKAPNKFRFAMVQQGIEDVQASDGTNHWNQTGDEPAAAMGAIHCCIPGPWAANAMMRSGARQPAE